MDNQYGSVAGILEQNSSFKSLLGEGFAKMKNHILSWSTEKLAVLVESFFSKLPSWKLVENIEGSIVDKIKAWGENSEEAQSELKYFFRQGFRLSFVKRRISLLMLSRRKNLKPLIFLRKSFYLIVIILRSILQRILIIRLLWMLQLLVR